METLFGDIPPAFAKESDEYYTPKILFDLLGVTFDLDPASPPGGSNVPCHKYYTQADNGLVQPWHGLVWMNPPFSHATPWVDKFIEHNNGIALLVVSRSKWFKKLWETASAIVSTPAELKFDRPNSKPESISFQTFLFALGEEAAAALHRANIGRVR